MGQEIPFVVLIAGAGLVGLWISNILFDLKVPHYVSRKIGHSAGGLGFLLCALLFSSGWWALIIAAAFALMLGGARYVRPTTFRGVGGSGRPREVMAEVWFPMAAIPVIGVGWIWLDKPLVAISCILFMAWGDMVTGIVRSQVYGRPVKGLWGSVAMLATCLVIAGAFIQPFWVGAVGAVVATITEWACGDVGLIKCLDDNLMIPLTSAATIFGILALMGG
ncbi:MAG: hypothetical protein E3J81_01040 [Dehalococcoidia bacterium]|nr:MAG: hypothetical protein E3J81_01040 [Dehalococcoidia bacterium]